MFGLGIRSLTAYTDRYAGLGDRLVNGALRWWPLPEPCPTRSAVCHRISFLYDRVHQHRQLNAATHTNLHEMFGVANIEAFGHLATMVRAGKIVGVSGDDLYLRDSQQLQQLDIPITFIHGSENACFLPESTQRTFEVLRKANPQQRYARHVIPGFGHLDCIYGKDAVNAVYPHVLAQLQSTLL
jgi:cholesterol oxidase